jgi:hypothetical protein
MARSVPGNRTVVRCRDPRRREERPEGLPPPTQKPNPSATLYLFRASVTAGAPGPLLLHGSVEL